MRSTLLRKREGRGFGCRGGEVRRVVERVWGIVEELGRGPDEEEKSLGGDGLRYSGES